MGADLTKDEGGLLTQLQDWVNNRLSTFPYFVGPPGMAIFTERRSDFVSKIEQVLATGLGKFGAGLALVVLTPKVTTGSHPLLVTASVEVLVSENVLLNSGTQGTRKAAVDVALSVYMAPILPAVSLGHSGPESTRSPLSITPKRTHSDRFTCTVPNPLL